MAGSRPFGQQCRHLRPSDRHGSAAGGSHPAEGADGSAEAAIEQRERSQQISSPDRNQFIASLREVVEKDLLPAPKAFQLIDAVERGAMPLSQAYTLVIDLLEGGR